jgi:RNA methyltransferase, TrmH family
MITSLHNERVKLASLLQSAAKQRRKHQKIVIEGVRLVGDALARGLAPAFVLHTPDVDTQLIAQLHAVCADVLLCDDAVMRHISDTQQPSGVLAVVPWPQLAPPTPLARVLILDALRDAGNMGTIARTAAAAGVQAILLSPDCVDPYNPKALRAGMGAHFRIPLISQTWDEIAQTSAHLPVYVADYPSDTRYTEVDWRAGYALIIGGEAHGASAAALDMARARVHVPLAAQTESLNAAAAAAVILFEAARQSDRGASFARDQRL